MKFWSICAATKAACSTVSVFRFGAWTPSLLTKIPDVFQRNVAHSEPQTHRDLPPEANAALATLPPFPIHWQSKISRSISPLPCLVSDRLTTGRSKYLPCNISRGDASCLDREWCAHWGKMVWGYFVRQSLVRNGGGWKGQGRDRIYIAEGKCVSYLVMILDSL